MENVELFAWAGKLHLVDARKELRQLRRMEHGYVKNAVWEAAA
jgi:hypothetical protein